jgi:uncharacterized protein YmfQ (DUF2313 family)
MAARYAVDDYAGTIQAHLPRGRVWPRETDTEQAAVVAAFAPAFERIDALASALLAGSLPGDNLDLLTEWEESLGLPDPCAGAAATVEARAAQVRARFIDTGGASVPYFIALASALGYDITIDEFTTSRFGKTIGGTYGGEDWAHTWRVNIPAFNLLRREMGDIMGEPYATWGSTIVQCEFLARKPAHTLLLFRYGRDEALGAFIIGINTLGA